jgi:hypothetical protein
MLLEVGVGRKAGDGGTAYNAAMTTNRIPR